VYDYHPGAETLEKHLFSNQIAHVPEYIVWSFVCQLVSALAIIHNHGLACRTLSTSKILLTGQSRVRLNCCGILDTSGCDRAKIQASQVEDLNCLGRVIVTLCCRIPFAHTSSSPQAVVKYLERVSALYSPEVAHLLQYLMDPQALGIQPNSQSAAELLPMISGHLLSEADNLRSWGDMLQSDMSKLLENGRLFRLIAKICFVTERPNHVFDPNWSETGDRFIVKLFHDFVFNQTMEDRTPLIDLSHVVDALNKLDQGSNEKILLLSRDEQTMIVSRYCSPI